MAIELKTNLQFSSNVSSDSSVSKSAAFDVSSRTIPPSLDMDVKKVSPELKEKTVSQHEISNSQKVPVDDLSSNDLSAVVSKLNDYVEQQKRDIRFIVDEDTNKTVVKLLDSNGDVLKQIPSEEVLAILRGIESNKGIFLEYQA